MFISLNGCYVVILGLTSMLRTYLLRGEESSGLKFDGTITLGNVVATLTFLILAAIAWTDLNWRVKNLEVWRTQHIIDANARDAIIKKMDKMLDRIDLLIEVRDRRAAGEMRTRVDDFENPHDPMRPR